MKESKTETEKIYWHEKLLKFKELETINENEQLQSEGEKTTESSSPEDI